MLLLMMEVEVMMGVIWQLQLVSKVQIYFLFYPQTSPPACLPPSRSFSLWAATFRESRRGKLRMLPSSGRRHKQSLTFSCDGC